MNRYAKGRRGEYKSIAWLKAKGYACIRAAGSKGPVDIVASNQEHVLYIQVKMVAKGPYPQDFEILRALPAPPSVIKLFHTWKPRAAYPLVLTV